MDLCLDGQVLVVLCGKENSEKPSRLQGLRGRVPVIWHVTEPLSDGAYHALCLLSVGAYKPRSCALGSTRKSVTNDINCQSQCDNS